MMKKYRKEPLAVESDLNGKRIGSPEGPVDPVSDILSITGLEISPTRRDFLKLCGFSFAAATLASCESKISKAIPFSTAPVEMTPGEPLHYASSYINGSDYSSIIIRTRDGRPIKIEGNPGSTITSGGTTARVQASVLDLYDNSRLKGPMKAGSPADWDVVDGEIMTGLRKIVGENRKIVLLTPTVFSPSTEAVIAEFLKKHPGAEWVMYDAISASGILEANEKSFGSKVIPGYRFDRADTIVSFGADFLGTWLAPASYTRQYSERRDPEQEMNYHIQIESGLTITGCAADRRIQIRPSQEYGMLLNIYREILLKVNGKVIEVPASGVEIDTVAERLLSSRGKSILISGSNSAEIQMLVNEINILLGNVGNTILFDSCLRTRRAVDSTMDSLVKRMNAGEIGALLFWNVNPSYTWHDKKAFNEGLARVELTVSLTGIPDESNEHAGYICPDNHFLESWNDAEPVRGSYSLMQPVIRPIFNTRQFAESILKWSGSATNYYEFIRSWWSSNLMPLQSQFTEPLQFFDNCVQKGLFEPLIRPASVLNLRQSPWLPEIDRDNLLGSDTEGDIEVILYEPVAIGEGRQANNPWLQELPDPVARICWDNFASLSVKQAGELGLSEGDVVDTGVFRIPVHLQPGQAYGTVSIALGYGRIRCGMVGEGVGTDVWPLISLENGSRIFSGQSIKISKIGVNHPLAMTQTHHSMEGRALVREASLDDFRKNPVAGNELHEYFAKEAHSLYKEREYPHHHWGMAIDLNKCTGCGNCVIACQAENNIPVVGKTEVLRVHEMHWMRIDRYYTGDDENPEIVFQPVLCQHCQNAPCENVCPVAATNHSSEGLNQMIYNRCFGTRYCNNNCPYKVRRFNWFNYTEAGTLAGNLRDNAGMTGELRRMVLNPDVTVRAQGVIEKCSFCIQRIQSAKLHAKLENRPLRSGEVQSACAQSCPANAIVFGDLNDSGSELGRLVRSGRRYNLLEELYTMPSVNYLTRIRNRIV